MKVLVTGAAGQVGCRLVRQMLERNHEVRGTILPEDPCRERLAGVDLDRLPTPGRSADHDGVGLAVR